MTTAIILAGGLGTRLRTVVPDAPKPMALINERPFLEHQLDYWIAQGLTRAILSVGYKHDVITSHFGKTYKGIPVHYAVETSPLGTGGGLLQAVALLSDREPFLVLNGDSFVGASLAKLSEAYQAKQADWTMVVFKADKPDRYAGINIDAKGQITALGKEKAMPGEWANAGVYMISPGVLTSLKWRAGEAVSLEEGLLPAVLASGKRCFTLPCDGVFIDIGVPEDYVRAAKLPAFN